MNMYRFPSWIWIIPILGVWFCICLGNRPFASPDEGRYVEIPREMVVSGDFVTPRLNGVKYFEKPPLFYWLQAATIKTLGLGESAMRLWTVVFGILGCVGTYLFARRFYGQSAALSACLVLATSPLYYFLSRLIILDMAVTALVSLSLFSFLMTIHTPPSLSRRTWAYAFYSFSALGVLTKGLMALAIPGPVIIIWALSMGNWKKLFPAYIPTGALLFFGIAAPWHILATLENPEFAHKYFIVEHFLRFTSSIHMRSKPFYFFVPVLLIGLFPWISYLIIGIRDALKGGRNFYQEDQRNVTIFLLIWAGWTFAFFSFSNSKLVPYVLPCFPPLAIILGSYWAKLHEPHHSPQARQAILSFATCATLLGIGGIIMVWFMPHLIDHRPHLWVDFTILSFVMIALAGLSLVFLTYRKIDISLAMTPIAAISIIISVMRVMPELQQASVKPFAEIILAMKKPEDVVGCFKKYYQDLPVYLQQRVIVAEATGEMDFGCDVEDCSQWMLNETQFLNLWRSNKRLLIIARATEIDALAKREGAHQRSFTYSSIAQNHGNVLITNRKVL